MNVWQTEGHQRETIILHHSVTGHKNDMTTHLGLTIAGQNDYCDTITIAESNIAILLLLQVPIAILLQ